mgnify:CR=1 FL=1
MSQEPNDEILIQTNKLLNPNLTRTSLRSDNIRCASISTCLAAISINFIECLSKLTFIFSIWRKNANVCSSTSFALRIPRTTSCSVTRTRNHCLRTSFCFPMMKIYLTNCIDDYPEQWIYLECTIQELLLEQLDLICPLFPTIDFDLLPSIVDEHDLWN